MGKPTPPVDPVAALAALTQNPQSTAPDDEPLEQLGPEDEAFLADLNALLDFVAKRTDGNIWDMQTLIAAGEEELRGQIREMVEGEDNG